MKSPPLLSRFLFARTAAILVVGGLLGASQPAYGQLSGDAARSTLSGVFTRDQANRGRDIYAGMCQSCHAAASHTGVAFINSWGGRRLSDLFAFVSEKMPKNDPGSLSPEDYTLVIAHILRLNGMPAGFEELPADSLALRNIRIEVRPKAP